MRFPILLLSIAFSFAFADSPGEGFVQIFNGTDLTGWEGQEGAWTVKDGAIVCTARPKGGKNWLIWRGGEPGDFELRLQFRFFKGNSGVQVRSDDLGEFQVQGYQVEVAAHQVMGLWHHSLSPEKYRSHLVTAGQKGTISVSGEKTHEQIADPAEIQAHCRDGEWNELIVIAKGSKLTQIINGVEFSELGDEDAKYARSSGFIALQDHGKGCTVEFREIWLKPIEE